MLLLRGSVYEIDIPSCLSIVLNPESKGMDNEKKYNKTLLFDRENDISVYVT